MFCSCLPTRGDFFFLIHTRNVDFRPTHKKRNSKITALPPGANPKKMAKRVDRYIAGHLKYCQAKKESSFGTSQAMHIISPKC